MLDYPAPEVVTIPRYITTPNVRVMMTVATVKDLRNAPPPESVSDEDRAGTDYIVVTEVTAADRIYRAVLRAAISIASPRRLSANASNAPWRAVYASMAWCLLRRRSMRRTCCGKLPGTG